MQISRDQGIIWTLSGLFLTYVGLRAGLVPITHDEVATCLNHVPQRVVEMVGYRKDASPNNHVLNTLGIKIFTGIFGQTLWSVRIPALIGAVVYLWAALGLSEKLAEKRQRPFLLLLLLGNPFLLDFFSLARGYGLAAGLMLGALYQTVLFSQNGEKKNLTTAAVLGALAVEASFTLLNFFAPFLVLLLWLAWQKTPGWRAFFQQSKPVWITSGVLILLVMRPLKEMRASDQFRFWGTSGFFKDTLNPLVKSSTHGAQYLGKSTVEILAIAAALFCFGAWLVAAVKFFQKKGASVQAPGIWLSLLFAGTIVVNVTQFYLIGTPFLNARTALFMIPLFSLQLYFVAAWMLEKNYTFRWFAIPVAAFVLLNLTRTVNFSEAYEWAYDQGSCKVIEYIRLAFETENRAEPFSIDYSWELLNSMGFHINETKTNYKKYLKTPDWHGDRTFPQNTDFYYTTNYSDALALDRDTPYEIVLTVKEGSLVLLRKK